MLMERNTVIKHQRSRYPVFLQTSTKLRQFVAKDPLNMLNSVVNRVAECRCSWDMLGLCPNLDIQRRMKKYHMVPE